MTNTYLVTVEFAYEDEPRDGTVLVGTFVTQAHHEDEAEKSVLQLLKNYQPRPFGWTVREID